MEYRKLIFPINKEEEERVGPCNGYKRQTASIHRFDYGIQITSRYSSPNLTSNHPFREHYAPIGFLSVLLSCCLRSQLSGSSFLFSSLLRAAVGVSLCQWNSNPELPTRKWAIYQVFEKQNHDRSVSSFSNYFGNGVLRMSGGNEAAL